MTTDKKDNGEQEKVPEWVESEAEIRTKVRRRLSKPSDVSHEDNKDRSSE